MSDVPVTPTAAANPDPILSTARAWLSQDPDQTTAARLASTLADAESGSDAALAELHAGFDTRIQFGTAGLRGEMGPGSARMNRVLVAQAASGLSLYLRAHEDHPTMVIGYDARHNSEVFARDTAEIATAIGVQVSLMPRALPTPVTAYALRSMNASAAVMVTASHNPAKDNGYKVYLGGADAGSQIISPSDTEIAAYIERVAADWKVDQLQRSNRYFVVPESVIDAYVQQTAAVAPDGPRTVDVVYTAMHGVGYETAARVFAAAGFAAPALVDEQIGPDPDFPTVAFPNPEESGALDLAFGKANQVHPDIIIANDPDADRLAVGIPDAANTAGWRRLSGNEVGWLLGEYLASRQTPGSDGALACSIVSSPLLQKIAARHGLRCEETLTGFKYVNRVPGLVFGYEEALGYLVDPELVRDKDGISAAVVIMALAADLKAHGLQLSDALESIAATYGAYASAQLAVRYDQRAEISSVMLGLRQTPPTSIAGHAVTEKVDLARGGALPPADILRYQLDDGTRVIVRPSGTEPKLKVYFDVTSTEGTLAQREQANAQRLEDLNGFWSGLLGR